MFLGGGMYMCPSLLARSSGRTFMRSMEMAAHGSTLNEVEASRDPRRAVLAVEQ